MDSPAERKCCNLVLCAVHRQAPHARASALRCLADRVFLLIRASVAAPLLLESSGRNALRSSKAKASTRRKTTG